MPRTAQLRELRPEKGWAVPLKEVEPNQEPGSPGLGLGHKAASGPWCSPGPNTHARRLLLAAV